MEDKLFELMEKMYSEMQNGFKKVDDRFNIIENRIGKIEIAVENDIKPKISICLEELVSVKEKQIEHDKRFDIIESKLEQHDVEISVIKRIK